MSWRATDNPNDACCWSAHVEEVDDGDPGKRPAAVADVRDRETADEIARDHNARAVAIAALCSARTQIEDASNDWPERERHEPPAVTLEKIRLALEALGEKP